MSACAARPISFSDEATREARATLEARLLQLEGEPSPESDLALLRLAFAELPNALTQLPRGGTWEPEALGLARWSHPEAGDILIFEEREGAPRVGLFLRAEGERWAFLARSRSKTLRLYLSQLYPQSRRRGRRILNSWLRAYRDDGPPGFYAGELLVSVRSLL